MSKLTMLAAFGAGYVLGARAGRERYDEIIGLAGRVTSDPHVRSAAATVADSARQQAPVVKDKVVAAAGAAASAAAEHSPFGSSGPDQELLDRLNPESTARQEHPYPQGDLP